MVETIRRGRFGKAEFLEIWCEDRIGFLERLIGQMLSSWIVVRNPEIERKRRVGGIRKFPGECPYFFRCGDVGTVGSEPAPVGNSRRKRDGRKASAERPLDDWVSNAQAGCRVVGERHSVLLLLR